MNYKFIIPLALLVLLILPVAQVQAQTQTVEITVDGDNAVYGGDADFTQPQAVVENALPGMIVKIRGVDFPPNTQINISHVVYVIFMSFTPPYTASEIMKIVPPVIASTTTDENGAFQLTFTLPDVYIQSLAGVSYFVYYTHPTYGVPFGVKITFKMKPYATIEYENETLNLRLGLPSYFGSYSDYPEYWSKTTAIILLNGAYVGSATSGPTSINVTIPVKLPPGNHTVAVYLDSLSNLIASGTITVEGETPTTPTQPTTIPSYMLWIVLGISVIALIVALAKKTPMPSPSY